MASWRFIFAILTVAVSPAAGAAKVAIDVGHYHEKPGAVSARGVAEFNYNLQLAQEVEAALRRSGHATLLIGENGLSADLAARAPRAKRMDLFISIHHDSVQPHYLETWEHEGMERRFSDRYSGFSLFVSRLNPGVETGLRCASAIGGALRAAGFAPSRYHAEPIAGENRPFADEDNGVHYFDNLAVLRTAAIPALLFEAGVIVHRDEELRMRDTAVRKRIVESIVAGVGECLK